MKISIEYKEKKYTVVYGKLMASGASVQEALDNLVVKFREEVSKFFTVQQ